MSSQPVYAHNTHTATEAGEQRIGSNTGSPAWVDATDPIAIINYLVADCGYNAVSPEDIHSLYTGTDDITFENLCANNAIAVTLDKRFLPTARFLSGDIFVKKEAYEKAVQFTNNSILRDKWLSQIEQLAMLQPVGGAEGITFGLRQKWIPQRYIFDFITECGYLFSSLPNGEFQIRPGTYSKHQGWNTAEALEKYLRGQSIGGTRTWEYKEIILDLETRFDEWMQAHTDITELTELYHRKFNSYCLANYETSPLDIAEHLSGNLILHPYQNAEVRRLLDEGKGICSFAVGLGKTSMALALAAFGLKQKRFTRACIVVPLSVLSVWRQEAETLFTPEFVAKNIHVVGEGTRRSSSKPRGESKRGIPKSPSAFAEEMTMLQNHKYPIVIMSKERFCALPLQKKTADSFLAYVQSFANPGVEKSAAPPEEKAQEIPFFEDMGFDCLIIDEAHAFKNSFEATSGMKRVAYLSTPPASKNAFNVAAKTYWVRSQTKGKGIYALTATPITNSPFEIFNMLSLVCPVSEFAGMGINTIDDIITVFGNVKPIGAVRVSGQVQQREALLGFKNLEGLRSLFTRYVNIKNADDVCDVFSIPERHEHEEVVPLSTKQQSIYETLRQKALCSENRTCNAVDRTAPILGIIREMDRLTIDIDFYERKTTFLFKQEHAQQVNDLITLFPTEWPQPEYLKDEKKWTVTLQPLKASPYKLPDGTLVLRLPETFQEQCIKLLPDVALTEEDVSHPLNPKYERLITRARAYLAEGGKQLVFTEDKLQHYKLRRLLAKHLNLPLTSIGIINADEAKGGRLARLANAYAANDVAILIANRKAELGVNLQSGTRAIHHLTLPWTPTSIEQRNGRGIRQGNDTAQVDVHYYFGEKTFDSYRRIIMQVKGNWIGQLMSGSDTTLENPESMDIQEILDVLASSPEEAKKRRAARAHAAQKAMEAKRQNSMFNALRSLTVFHESIQKRTAKQQSALRKCLKRESELQQKLNMSQDTLNKINEVIQERQKLLTQMLPADVLKSSKKEISAATKESTKYTKQVSRLRNNLQIAREAIASLQDAADGAEKNDSQRMLQALLYLRRMQAADKLPFPATLLDELGQFAVVPAPQNTIVRIGETYRATLVGKGSFCCVQVTALSPQKNSAIVDIYDPKTGRAQDEILLRKLSMLPPVPFDTFILDNVWRYGTIHTHGIFSEETFVRLAPWLRFDPKGGAVYHTGTEFLVAWRNTSSLPAGAVPAWPDPSAPAFREALCRRYLADKNIKGVVNEQLMSDLLGDEFETISLAYAEGEDAELFQLMGQVIEQAKKSTNIGPDADEAALLKIQTFFRAQTALNEISSSKDSAPSK